MSGSRVPRVCEGENSEIQLPACDSCKARKIRCDRHLLCSQCKSSSLQCTRSRQPPSKRRRVLLSDEHQAELSEIKAQLKDINSTLKSCEDPFRKQDAEKHRYTTSFTLSHILGDVSTPQKPGWTLFTGDPSFQAHSMHLIETYKPKDLPVAQVDQAEDTNIYSRDIKDWRSRPSYSASLSNLPTLRANLMLDILHTARALHSTFFDYYPFIDREDLISLCQSLFFPIEGLSLATILTVQCSTFLILQDIGKAYAQQLGLSQVAVQEILSHCASNLFEASELLPLSMNPSLENLISLVLLATVFIESDRYEQASSLVSFACRLCVEAGYHRMTTDSTLADLSKKRLLFWQLYALDRGFSLSIGRAPVIADYDIRTERPRPDELSKKGAKRLLGWIRVAEIQGKIYEYLYSVRAQDGPSSLRAEHAQSLAQTLEDLNANAAEPSDHESAHDSFVGNVYREIVFNSLLTLIHLAVEEAGSEDLADGHNFKSLTHARTALGKLSNAWGQIGQERTLQRQSLLVWMVQFFPFAPFIVVFSHLIRRRGSEDPDDLNLLRRVNVILTAAVTDMCSISKVYATCKTLLGVAERATAVVVEKQEETTRLADPGPDILIDADNGLCEVNWQGIESMPLFLDSWYPLIDDLDFWCREGP